MNQSPISVLFIASLLWLALLPFTYSTAGCESRYPKPSFSKWNHLTPRLKVTNELSYPLGSYHPTYAGLGMWNSRGTDLRRAVLAMLGDPYQYYETPLFTLFKLIYMNRSSDITQYVRPSEPNHFQGTYFKMFLNRVVKTETEKLKIMEPISEIEAVCKARETIDERFVKMSDLDIENRFLRFGAYGDDPWDCLYAQSYVGFDPHYYGPDMVVFNKDVEERGIDLNWYHKKFYCYTNGDTGEIMTYGYKEPSTIRGFELRGTRSATNIYETNPLRYAFYKVEINQIPVILIVTTRNSSNFVYCVHQTQDNSFKVCDSKQTTRLVIDRPDFNFTENNKCGYHFPVVLDKDLDVVGFVVSYSIMEDDVNQFEKMKPTLQYLRNRYVNQWMPHFNWSYENVKMELNDLTGMSNLEGNWVTKVVWFDDSIFSETQLQRKSLGFGAMLYWFLMSIAVGATFTKRVERNGIFGTSSYSMLSDSVLFLTLLSISSASYFVKLFTDSVELQCYVETDHDLSPISKCTMSPSPDCHPIQCPSQSILNGPRLSLYPSIWFIGLTSYASYVVISEYIRRFGSRGGPIWGPIAVGFGLFPAVPGVISNEIKNYWVYCIPLVVSFIFFIITPRLMNLCNEYRLFSWRSAGKSDQDDTAQTPFALRDLASDFDELETVMCEPVEGNEVGGSTDTISVVRLNVTTPMAYRFQKRIWQLLWLTLIAISILVQACLFRIGNVRYRMNVGGLLSINTIVSITVNTLINLNTSLKCSKFTTWWGQFNAKNATQKKELMVALVCDYWIKVVWLAWLSGLFDIVTNSGSDWRCLVLLVVGGWIGHFMGLCVVEVKLPVGKFLSLFLTVSCCISILSNHK